MVKKLMTDCYSGVTRYTTSGFLRMKLGDALTARDVAPYIYESAEEAKEHLLEEAKQHLLEEAKHHLLELEGKLHAI